MSHSFQNTVKKSLTMKKREKRKKRLEFEIGKNAEYAVTPVPYLLLV